MLLTEKSFSLRHRQKGGQALLSPTAVEEAWWGLGVCLPEVLLCAQTPPPPAWVLAAGEGPWGAKDTYSGAVHGPFIGGGPRTQTHMTTASLLPPSGEGKAGRAASLPRMSVLRNQCQRANGVTWEPLPRWPFRGRSLLSSLCGQHKKEVRADLHLCLAPGSTGPLWRPSAGPSQEH